MLQLLEIDPKTKKGEFLREFEPIATCYILANFFCNGKTGEMNIIRSMLVQTTRQITNEQMVSDTESIFEETIFKKLKNCNFIGENCLPFI